jgi:hypothetical protein
MLYDTTRSRGSKSTGMGTTIRTASGAAKTEGETGTYLLVRPVPRICRHDRQSAGDPPPDYPAADHVDPSAEQVSPRALDEDVAARFRR